MVRLSATVQGSEELIPSHPMLLFSLADSDLTFVFSGALASPRSRSGESSTLPQLRRPGGSEACLAVAARSPMLLPMGKRKTCDVDVGVHRIEHMEGDVARILSAFSPCYSPSPLDFSVGYAMLYHYSTKHISLNRLVIKISFGCRP